MSKKLVKPVNIMVPQKVAEDIKTGPTRMESTGLLYIWRVINILYIDRDGMLTEVYWFNISAIFWELYTTWKVSVFGFFLVRILLQTECWKIRSGKTSNADTFYAMIVFKTDLDEVYQSEIIRLTKTKAYSKSWQTSKMENFAEIVWKDLKS